MCLNETYSRVRIGKNLPDMFRFRNGLKQGDALSLFLFNFALEYAFRRVQVNQDGNHKMRGISCLAENRLTSQEGFRCMEEVSKKVSNPILT